MGWVVAIGSRVVPQADEAAARAYQALHGGVLGKEGIGRKKAVDVAIASKPRPHFDPWDLGPSPIPIPSLDVLEAAEYADDDVRACVRCGCTDNDCIECIRLTGRPCSWVLGLDGEDRCSACDGLLWWLREALNRDLAMGITEPGPGWVTKDAIDAAGFGDELDFLLTTSALHAEEREGHCWVFMKYPDPVERSESHE